MAEPQWSDDIVFPALLGAARRVYGAAMREALVAGGFDDMPRRGAAVVGGIARNGAPQRDFARNLGLSKQAASQLVDALVTRGYLERAVDGDDRRRTTLTLTARGRAAARASRAAVERVDAELVARAGAADVATARRVLGTLYAIGAEPRDPRAKG